MYKIYIGSRVLTFNDEKTARFMHSLRGGKLVLPMGEAVETVREQTRQTMREARRECPLNRNQLAGVLNACTDRELNPDDFRFLINVHKYSSKAVQDEINAFIEINHEKIHTTDGVREAVISYLTEKERETINEAEQADGIQAKMYLREITKDHRGGTILFYFECGGNCTGIEQRVTPDDMDDPWPWITEQN